MYYITEDGKEILRRRMRWKVTPTEWDALELVSSPQGSELTEIAIEEKSLDPIVERALGTLIRKGLVSKDEGVS